MCTFRSQEKVRGQLRISGVTLNLYWGSYFLVDYLQYLFLALMAVIVLVAFQVFNSTYLRANIICNILQKCVSAPFPEKIKVNRLT